MGQARPERYAKQEDQWAVVQREVEQEDVHRRAEGPGRDQRDTEDDANTLQEFIQPIEQAPNHVDIVVVGVGGGGMNAIDRMINTRVRGVRYVVLNTDAQVLSLSKAPELICRGQHSTKGHGRRSNAPLVNRAASEI